MVSFETHIAPLFREEDREAMLYIMDLWDRDDVANDAANILDRVLDGTMPCDAPWPKERIDLFRAWIDGGFQP
ncbi:MAG TPA: hypothetical protein VNQ73_03625 [Ilumatobacter sp.]|nr:hypothetical protein [Ilumatobacter sp.]